MKRIVISLLFIIFLFSLTACGKTETLQLEPPSKLTGLENAENEAWVCLDAKVAYVFQVDGTYIQYILNEDSWKKYYKNTFTFENNVLQLGTLSHNAILNGDSLKITFDNVEYTYVKTQNFLK